MIRSLSVYSELAESYASAHAIMAKPHESCEMTSQDDFYKRGGITNGAQWYSVAGGTIMLLCLCGKNIPFSRKVILFRMFGLALACYGSQEMCTGMVSSIMPC